MIDINFDFRKECDYPAEDPDSASRTLLSYHHTLWNKILPNGEKFDLKKGKNTSHYLYWNEMRFGSDTMNSTYSYTKYKQIVNILPNIPKDIMEDFRYRVYTIGNCNEKIYNGTEL